MTMRMVFWGGCAAVVATAAGVYLAAGDAADSDSMARKVVRGACLSTVGPVATVGEAAYRTAQQVAGSGSPEAEDKPVAASEPHEVIDLAVESHNPVVIEEAPWHPEAPAAHECPAQPCVPEGITIAPVVTIPAGGIEESEPPVAVAVPADPEVPATMPKCEDAEEIPAPKTEVKAENACGFWDFFFKHRSVEAKPMPAAEEGTPEESESMPEGKPTDCRVCPDYPHEYPGCPVQHGKTKASGESEESEPMPKHFPEEFDSLPEEPKVDTMEFRKTDAKKGEFAPKPF